MAKTLVALFDDRAEARAAIGELRDAGFTRDDITVIAQQAKGETVEDWEGAKADTGVEIGAASGAALGGIGGFLAGLGTLAIPGIGPAIAAGPLLAAIVGATGGLVAGGAVGGLIGLGLPEGHANWYVEGVRRGGTLLLVNPPDERVEEARGILEKHDPVEIDHDVLRDRPEVREAMVGGMPQGAVRVLIVERRVIVGAAERPEVGTQYGA